MHKSVDLISLATKVSICFGVFKSVSSTQCLNGVALLNEALGKLSRNLKSLSFPAVKGSLY